MKKLPKHGKIKSSKYEDYFSNRLTFEPRRKIIWQVLCQYFNKKYIKSTDKVIELGSGYCDFINQIQAKKKYAVDGFLNPHKYADKNIKCLFQSIEKITNLPLDYFDVIFASNLLEHLDDQQLKNFSVLIQKILKPGGKLILLQPNFFYAFREYFHDYTHQKIFTHISLSEWLESQNFKIITIKKKFLPFSLKDGLSLKIPSILLKIILKFYLLSPFKPLARQMLIITQKNV